MSFLSCCAFSLLVQKFSISGSFPSEKVFHAEVHGLVSTFGSSPRYLCEATSVTTSHTYRTNG